MEDTSKTPRQGDEIGSLPQAVHIAYVAAAQARATELSEGGTERTPPQASDQQVPFPSAQTPSIDLGAVQDRGHGENAEAFKPGARPLRSPPETGRGEQLHKLGPTPVRSEGPVDNGPSSARSQGQTADHQTAGPKVILRPDMTEEEMDDAAARLRPPSQDELAIRLTTRYRMTITGMLKRKVSYQTILTVLEQGPDGSDFKEYFGGNHHKLGRYLREKCPKN